MQDDRDIARKLAATTLPLRFGPLDATAWMLLEHIGTHRLIRWFRRDYRPVMTRLLSAPADEHRLMQDHLGEVMSPQLVAIIFAPEQPEDPSSADYSDWLQRVMPADETVEGFARLMADCRSVIANYTARHAAEFRVAHGASILARIAAGGVYLTLLTALTIATAHGEYRALICDVTAIVVSVLICAKICSNHEAARQKQ